MRGSKGSDSANGAGSLVKHRRGLGSYRRFRPFELHPIGEKRYQVIDTSTRELLGTVESLDDYPDSFGIDLETSTAPAKRVRAWNQKVLRAEEPRSAMEAANRLWSLAFPAQSIWWRLLRLFVLFHDWVTRGVFVTVRLVIVLAFLAFVLKLVPFLNEVREDGQIIVLQYLGAMVEDEGKPERGPVEATVVGSAEENNGNKQ